MSRHEPATGQRPVVEQVVTWKEDGIWHTDEIDGVRDGEVLVGDAGERRRISESDATITPISPFKNSPHPRDLGSRSFMNALREVVATYGIDEDGLSIVWSDDRPYCTFPPSVDRGTIQSIRRDVDDLTNSDVDPQETELTCLRM